MNPNPRKQLERIEICAGLLLETARVSQGRRIGPATKRAISMLANEIHAITRQWSEELSKPLDEQPDKPEGDAQQ